MKSNGNRSILADLSRYKTLINNTDKLLEKIVEVGAEEVRKAHEGSIGTDMLITKEGEVAHEMYSDIEVNLVKGIDEYTIRATGVNFLFYEFGAGISYNAPRSWENVLGIDVPDDISPIGTYGKGKGANPSWVYKNEDGLPMRTKGYKAVNGFGNAINRIVDELDTIVKEALNGK